MSLQRVLFVCLGNSCRSQMAEGFARAYGRDVLTAASAGLAPAALVSPLTRQVMAEKYIPIDDHFPKGLEEVPLAEFDLVVNMSGYPLPRFVETPAIEWQVDDPMGSSERFYREVRNCIERLVMGLILELRRQAGTAPRE